ncbi:beta-1,3-N-acetylglucosaminyltransferase manic fringe-like [Perca flavescens]|uniref:beta-1,3-N-acetylglucosaminyltransferase manic fringe-like n=1 Tax=Perca flavescens TaxID=8167 RepID=UPI00106E5D5E|nr:beta-1,3-N-acetylglucosaminyltransferase manic fringe-like [Perca flavescens]
MQKKWIRRRLTVLILTIFIILYVDFQLRTSSPPKLSVAHHPSPFVHQPPIHRALSPATDAQTPSSSSTGNGGHPASGVAHVTQPKLKLEDIFVAVKTTGRFHKTRLALLLETWISRTKAHTFIFTDTEDVDLHSKGYNMVVTGCQSDHSQQALSCKMSAESRRLHGLRQEALLSLLSAFPQDGDIYVGKPSLDKPITAHELLKGNATAPHHSVDSV